MHNFKGMTELEQAEWNAKVALRDPSTRPYHELIADHKDLFGLPYGDSAEKKRRLDQQAAAIVSEIYQYSDGKSSIGVSSPSLR